MSSNETLESMLICTEASSQQVDNNNKKPRPADEQAQKCPRCDSANTKFCYYNNYSLTQPRYFCKSCKRYWTKGGTLRNVPAGGVCRKNNKTSFPDSSASSNIRTIDQNHPQQPLVAYDHNHQLLPYEYTDHPLEFARLQNGQLGFEFDHDQNDSISVLGNYANNVHGPVLDSMWCGNFLESLPVSNGLQDVCYGEDHYYESVGKMSYEEMRNLPCEDMMRGGSGGYYATTLKQQGRAEGCYASCETTKEEGDGGMGTAEVDTTERQSSWINEFGSSNCHGFLNSPLM